MSKLFKICAAGILGCALSAAAAQDNSTTPSSPASGSGQEPAQEPQQPEQQPVQPVPAYGQENTPPTISENPPISGLDLPSLEPHAAPLSYVQAGARVSEALDSNPTNTLGGGTNFRSVSRALGSVTLRRLWRNYDLGVDYLGGVGYYNVQGEGWKSLQQMDLEQKITWKRGQLSLRDSFSYLPEGNFGGAYGGLGTQGIESLGTTAFGSFWGGSSLGTLGLAPRILNLSLAEVEQRLTPKSAITAAGGYTFSHFYGVDDVTGASFIGSSQVSAQTGYDRILTPHTQMALVYGYQGFDFSVLGTAFHSHVIQGMYGHRISGRMDLLIGAGPQITFIDTITAGCSDSTIPPLLCTFAGDTLVNTTDKNTRVGVAARARLRYQFTRTSVSLNYERFETSGSGLFTGAQTDVIRLGAFHPLNRVWTLSFDLGYSHNSRIQPLTIQQIEQCTATTQTSQTACPANDARSYNVGFIGGGVHRDFGRTLRGNLSYQFSELGFDSSFCVGTGACDRISHRNTIMFGLDWTPRPIRID
ncbi:MAG TPA: hypothetical protein VMH04_07875 [Candidatus Solibacter sp.]|nr:hypothetical protein [Candidatus Solibacter sp.]